MFHFFKVNGTHSSEDMPPKIPFFTDLRASRTMSPTPTHSGPHGSSEAVLTTSQQGKEMNLEKKVYSYVYEHKYMNIRPSNYRRWLRHCCNVVLHTYCSSMLCCTLSTTIVNNCCSLGMGDTSFFKSILYRYDTNDF